MRGSEKDHICLTEINNQREIFKYSEYFLNFRGGGPDIFADVRVPNFIAESSIVGEDHNTAGAGGTNTEENKVDINNGTSVNPDSGTQPRQVEAQVSCQGAQHLFSRPPHSSLTDSLRNFAPPPE